MTLFNTQPADGIFGGMMRTEPLEQMYVQWLYDQLRTYEQSDKSQYDYTELTDILFKKEFVWTVPNDDNRIADGMELRMEFINIIGERVVDYALDTYLNDNCSILEVIIGLSRRLAFEGGGSAPSWAWLLIQNLELHKFQDPISRNDREKVDDIVYSVIWRTYDKNGQGGFFPLIETDQDQRKVELWYQMSAYLAEHINL